MEESTEAGFYIPAQGTIAGFTGIDLPGQDADVSKTGWSSDWLRKYLLNEGGGNFPNGEWLQDLEHLITTHLDDHNNPHKVTLDQIIGNITKDILANIVPGTIPDNAPFFSYDATCPLPLNNIFPAVFNTTNLYRMTEGGEFVDPASEVEVMGVDYSTLNAGLPLFSSVVNKVPTGWASDPSLPINTRVVKVDHSPVNYPFDFYRVDETDSTGEFGVSVLIAETPSLVHTMTIFIMPLYIDGYFHLRQPGIDTPIMTVNVETHEVSFGSNLISGEVLFYPSNLLKISFSFIADATAPKNRVRIIHQGNSDGSYTRVGRAGQPLFLVAQPSAAIAGIGYPLPIDLTKASSATPFTPKLNILGAPATIDRLMVSVALHLVPLPLGLSTTDTNIITFGAVALIRDNTKVYLKHNGVTICSADILPGHNVFSFSVSPTTMMLKSLSTEKQIVKGSYRTLDTTNVVLGPCGGYLKHVSMYGQDDNNKCLEFLTNG